MSRLEQKLIELGYEKVYFTLWEKIFLNNFIIRLEVIDNKITDRFELVNHQNIIIKTQFEINNLQQAFNELQRDLEFLKECEEDEKE